MRIEADLKFLELWNKSFSKALDWTIKEKYLICRNSIFKSYKIISPWHPILFTSDLKNKVENESYSFLNNRKDVYGLICVPYKNIKDSIKKKIIKENLILHFILIENKKIDVLYKNYKYNVRREIKLGYKKYNFKRLKSKADFSYCKDKINELLINQHLYFKSPSPPIELIESLFLNQAMDIYIAKSENKIVGFMSMTNDKNIAQIAWAAKSISTKDLSIAFHHFCLNEAIKRGAKIFSLGTSSSKSLAKFKEKLNSEKAILFKRKIYFRNESKDLKYLKSNRKKFTIKIMNILIKSVFILFGKYGFQFISKEIWKRFD